MKPVVLAGGSGSRLWPKSRAALPKQFLALTSEQTMLQETLQRLDGSSAANPIVICNDAHRFLVAEQLRQMGGDHGGIILEPVGRNTAPAIALAALHAMQTDDDPVLLVLAADHLIKDSAGFQAAVSKANELAMDGNLVTFGIVPDQAHTGYGYIKGGEAIGVGMKVDEFVEKPDLATAQQYVDSGNYFWNSGMFMFKASVYLAELKKHAPEMYSICEQAIASESKDLDFIRIDPEIFATCPDDSIDYAVMEKTALAAMVPLDAGWSDVGSWSSLWETADNKDENGNVIVGDAILEGVNNSYINAEERLIAVVGLDDVVVVETKDAVMVANKNKVQDIKNVVNKLKAEQRPEFQFHREVFRPWGSYDSIDNGKRFQVKRITVKPGEKLSVQMHHHRAEHWIVVSGTANVTIGEKTQLVTENESVYIPIGDVHALENPGKIPLELIEVQSGAYLGEDDIVRFSDRYGRTESK
ncbi:MAG: mannose-1-phosphate guanylyltransferase/mannose-6-phosphate isomerase [Pseudomonadota bacterium]|jgi:mannose-1-phosphate guanylyltransferase/mannose-6-phosphate isomerase|uniref:mannose-1-phosphate guanylyltransferase n=1 Tax=Alteromonas alba TaxID=2079529 RepID=A0A2S9V3Y0_9ALTE|nr:mannose-1-phosphate guanylyltransferase/mannose-6-phosphate isomerase [Alteromonas alba]MAD09529.1 mannose-1-phosphate guanylyltransferase/mannose-6-phosphate isomerase [Alteromonas sp.]MDY6927642.1 mannose-1-phosphate guanylyltransferase/mannose-6-phosphate isomerase [Pseudomonadota bacterium]MCP4864564.1 mannose-1-phosphate guanylyltransferase/mannose-6-phosphate isomerase [Alteromonas sp.]MEC9262391.1 mannose-1-phosphate guanylyltransferase/mannose-6-phosphate isomerase [Pseudomonadota ba|tara:strand:- start:422 stop:1834 length:1413 start_codon:yes stop_codon:yes gene_type:complete